MNEEKIEKKKLDLKRKMKRKVNMIVTKNY